MVELMQAIAAFAAGHSVWVYVFIFCGKVAEVTVGTLRMVLINRGERAIGSLLAFIEIMLWLIIASSVLSGFQEDFLKGVMYGLAFAAGNYLGSRLDERLAFGLCSVQAVLPSAEYASLIGEALRAKGFGLTTMDVHGQDADRKMLLMTMKRKRSTEAIKLIEKLYPDAVISVTDIKTQHGGYLGARRPSHQRIGK